MSTIASTELIRIRVPGTTSNFGPGFDCLGAALQLYNEITLTFGEPGPVHPMVEAATNLFYEQPELSGQSQLRFRWSARGQVPISRGLGSSVTLRLGILEGLNEAHDCPLSRRRLFELCTALEGHPDNAGPAVFGGFFIGNPKGDYFSFPIQSQLRFVILIRTLEVSTEASRKVLPDQVSRRNAVENVGYACSIAAAFASEDYEGLRGVFCDHFHQPFRETVNPGLSPILRAGEAAGALGGFLSGSGSSIICLTTGADGAQIGAAMRAACPDPKVAEVHVVKADNQGSHRINSSEEIKLE